MTSLRSFLNDQVVFTDVSAVCSKQQSMNEHFGINNPLWLMLSLEDGGIAGTGHAGIAAACQHHAPERRPRFDACSGRRVPDAPDLLIGA